MHTSTGQSYKNCCKFCCCFTVLSENIGDGTVRLVEGNFTFEGRVEIYHNKEWGTICDDGWGMEEASVVCHQLGYMKGAQYWYGNAKFKEGQGKIWLDDVVCYGNESALTHCHNIGWNGHNCRHYEDVGVVCLPKGECTSCTLRTNALSNGPCKN